MLDLLQQHFCIDITSLSHRFFATMVLISDRNSEIGTHVRSNLFLFDMLKAFDEIRSSHNFPSSVQHVPSYDQISTMAAPTRPQNVLVVHVPTRVLHSKALQRDSLKEINPELCSTHGTYIRW